MPSSRGSSPLPHPVIGPTSPASPALQADSLLLSHWESQLLIQMLLKEKKIIWTHYYSAKDRISSLFCSSIVGKESTCNAGDRGEESYIPGSGRSPGGGHGNAPQCSCLENPMDRGAWWATVHGVTESWTLLTKLNNDIEGKEGGRDDFTGFGLSYWKDRLVSF